MPLGLQTKSLVVGLLIGYLVLPRVADLIARAKA